jgi:hypothetical protein
MSAPQCVSAIRALGAGTAATMDIALYNLILLRAAPRRHPRRDPRLLSFPAKEMKPFATPLLFSGQVVETDAGPAFLELAVRDGNNDISLHPQEILFRLSTLMNRANRTAEKLPLPRDAQPSEKAHETLASDLAAVAALAMWLKHHLMHVCWHVSAKGGKTGRWEEDLARLASMAEEGAVKILNNLPQPWEGTPAPECHPLQAGTCEEGIWLRRDMAAALRQVFRTSPVAA